MDKKLNEFDIKIAGINALNKKLGPIYALKFLMLINKNPADSIELSKKIASKILFIKSKH
jgi:hypothetical protein